MAAKPKKLIYEPTKEEQEYSNSICGMNTHVEPRQKFAILRKLCPIKCNAKWGSYHADEMDDGLLHCTIYVDFDWTKNEFLVEETHKGQPFKGEGRYAYQLEGHNLEQYQLTALSRYYIIQDYVQIPRTYKPYEGKLTKKSVERFSNKKVWVSVGGKKPVQVAVTWDDEKNCPVFGDNLKQVQLMLRVPLIRKWHPVPRSPPH